MLVNANEVLKKAKEGKYAVPHFNIHNMESVRYTLEVCQELQSPVFLGISSGAAKYAGGYKVFAKIVEALIETLKITIPVITHLDHGPSFEECKDAIDSGLTSVMIDASKYEIDKNIEITKQVVEYAHKYNVSVEAEVGHVGGKEEGVVAELAYANVDDCDKLVRETNLDFFAPALGSVHGLYKGEPKIDFDKMEQIKEISKLPLVLHGGSGLPDEIITKGIATGISKINVDTEIRIGWTTGIKEYLKNNPEEINIRAIIKSGEENYKNVLRKKIVLFGSNNKA